MVNDVRALLQEAVSDPAGHDPELGAILSAGRRRVRRRRGRLAAGTAAVAAVAAAFGVLVTTGEGSTDGDRVAQQLVPRPDGPVLHLTDAADAVEGVDYDVLATYTNKDLNAGNGQYFSGLTDDGLILFEDGPHGVRNKVRYGLREPASGRTTWLPAMGVEAAQTVPVDLGRERLVLTSTDYRGGDDLAGPLRAHVYDRAAGSWRTMVWPSLPGVAGPFGTRVGPDGRLYVGIPATEGSPPPGGWPTGPDGEAEDAGAEGETYDLWSVSLADPGDVRDERTRVGSFAFTDDALVWSATTNGTNERIHVRDLATGREHDFDPRSGERCNLLGFGASGDRIVLGQYCGTYDDGRDDRVQVLTTDGETVTTIQGDGLGGGVAVTPGDRGGLAQLTVHAREHGGHYVYELGTGRLVRVTEATSSWGLGGPTPSGHLLWDTPYGAGAGTEPEGVDAGATQWLARWRN